MGFGQSDGNLPDGVEPHSVDIAVMIFVFSALAPNQWDQAMDNLHKILKPGGKIIFRDYGAYDLTQVNFKKNRILEGTSTLEVMVQEFIFSLKKN